jgi:hypothetical protein
VSATITPIESTLRRSIREQLARRQAEATELFTEADSLQSDSDTLHEEAEVKYREAGRAQFRADDLAKQLEALS